MTIQQAFALALQHHQAGRLGEAEALYRQILAVQPNHADALHFLGVIAHQVGRSDLAVEWIQRAVSLNPNEPGAHTNLGEAYRALGRLDEAIASYRRALALKPDEPAALNNLGNALRQRGQLPEAIAAFESALRLAPDYAEAHNNLGVALAESGLQDQAIAQYRQAIDLLPGYADARNNLGNSLRDQGRWDAAIAEYRRLIASRPDHAEAHNNLGVVLAEQGQMEEAIAQCRRATELKPGYTEAWVNLGNFLANHGDVPGAVHAYRGALEQDPKNAKTLCKLASLLVRHGEQEEAISICRRALEWAPDDADVFNNLGAAYQALGKLDEAVDAFRETLRCDPRHAVAWNNLGNTFCDQGRVDESIAAYRESLRLDPDNLAVRSNLIFSLQFQPGLEPGVISEEKRAWDWRFGGPLKALHRPHENSRELHRRLRVGYVSQEFRSHVVGRNLIPLFHNHDGQEVEVVCYSDTILRDEMTPEFRKHCALWREAAGVSDDALAEMIRRDAVDILVDLSQHSAGNRLPLFARKPAPVQVSFAGYPAGTGLEAIEYRISDPWLEGRGREKAEGRMTKDVLAGGDACLIDSFWCYDPCGAEVDVNELPANENGHITFGSLNSFFKVNASVLKLWGRVLGAVKDSRLVLLSREGSHRQRTLDCLAREGIDGERIRFVEPGDRMKYLRWYQLLDIALDPFPYGGHTTSLDALWMGVPVIGLAGPVPVSRAALSILSNLGLPELVGLQEEDYVDIAVRLASDLPRLAELRRTLRTRMDRSVLMDATRFARGIEAAYRAMWQRWCAL